MPTPSASRPSSSRSRSSSASRSPVAPGRCAVEWWSCFARRWPPARRAQASSPARRGRPGVLRLRRRSVRSRPVVGGAGDRRRCGRAAAAGPGRAADGPARRPREQVRSRCGVIVTPRVSPMVPVEAVSPCRTKVSVNPTEACLTAGVVVRYEPGQVDDAFMGASDEGVLEGVEDQVGGHRGGCPPAGDAAGGRVDDECDRDEPGPGRDVGTTRRPPTTGSVPRCGRRGRQGRVTLMRLVGDRRLVPGPVADTFPSLLVHHPSTMRPGTS